MRKQLYAVAAAILAAGMLAGCSGGAKETEEQTSVQAEILAERTRSQVVQVIGRKIVLYKEGKDDKKKIVLP